MLSALAQWYPNGKTEGAMRAHAGMKKSGTFSTYMSDLRGGGYVEKRGDLWCATRAGVDYFGAGLPKAPRSTAEVLDVWNPKLREGARRMLAVLVRHRGRVIARDALAQESGMVVSGTFSTYLSDLKTAQLAVVGGDGVAANRDTLFL